MNKESEDMIVGAVAFVGLILVAILGTLLYVAYERGIQIKQPIEDIEPIEMPIYLDAAVGYQYHKIGVYDELLG